MLRDACKLTLLATVLASLGCSSETRPPEGLEDGSELAALAEDAWQHARARNAYLQVRTGGLLRELPDLSPEAAADDAAFARRLLERLDSLDTRSLQHEDALTAAILRWDAEMTVASEPYYWLTFPYTPYAAGFGLNFLHTQLAAYPFTDPVRHPQSYLALLAEYADSLDQLTTHAEGQSTRGIYLSRHALPGVLGLFRSIRETVPGLMAVSPERLGALDEPSHAAFREAVSALVAERVLPALDGLLAVLGSDSYSAAAPNGVGLTQYAEGAAWYRLLVRQHTTMEVTPEELHELGKLRLAQLEEVMAAIRREVGFAGTREEFHQMLRTDPRFFARSPDEVEARFEAYVRRIEPRVGELFRSQPRAPYGVERLEPEAEATMTFGYYQPPTPEQPVGRYRYNGSRLDERPLLWAGPLIYHELIPGHHFHIASQAENESLPPYRREYLGATAFTEGWGNYAALLASELGLLEDPYERYGAALFDAFVSSRLVLDTGMNLMGWSLDEGREFMRRHTFQSETEIATETLRYSTDLNGQALAYKAGLEKLLELREEARSRAGASFDIRDFHQAVLGSGAMPLTVLEQHILWAFDRQGQR